MLLTEDHNVTRAIYFIRYTSSHNQEQRSLKGIFIAVIGETKSQNKKKRLISPSCMHACMHCESVSNSVPANTVYTLHLRETTF